jgi:type II secretory pathway pseudopilin PulG
MTRHRSIVSIALLLLLFALPTVTSAQKSVRLSATPKQFQVFYAKFRSAMLRKDKTTIATMTHFPFDWGLDAGDEGTYKKSEFLRNYNRLFDPVPAEFRLRNPKLYSEDGHFTLSTDGASHFGFERKGNTYKFVSFIVEP